jgi:TonB family protein
MAHAAYSNDRELSQGIKWSIIAHLALFTFVIAKTLVFPSRPVLYIPSLRVDIVGLPDQLKNENIANTPPSETLTEALKRAEQEARKIENKVKPLPKAPKAEKAEPDEMVLKPKKSSEKEEKADDAKREKKMKSALDRIKALEKIKDDVKPASNVVKGNKVSRGTSLSADARESAEGSYFDLIKDRLHDHWALPVFLQRQNLKARVLIKIDNRGRLRSFVFEKASGNPAFDREVERTLQQSQPFPVPPDEVASSVLVDGISVGFPL